MIVVDSSVWIAWIRDLETPQTRRLSSEIETRSILVGDIVLLEVLRGARNDLQARALELRLRKFPIAGMLDRELAVQAATNYRLLRGLGITIRSTVDLIIAAYCIRHDHQLLQEDRDFRPMVEHLGLRLA